MINRFVVLTFIAGFMIPADAEEFRILAWHGESNRLGAPPGTDAGVISEQPAGLLGPPRDAGPDRRTLRGRAEDDADLQAGRSRGAAYGG
jgi:hypothetical protein